MDKFADSATRFPLSWPFGWKRMAPGQRKRASFSRRETVYSDQPGGSSWSRRRDMTVSEACDRIFAELSRMGVQAGNVVVSTNVQTRLDGRPYSNRGDPEDPGAAVYWRTKQGDKVMAIDRYDRVADNLAAIAATLDAMRAIERHGGAAILDRAFTGFTALPSPEAAAVPPWRTILGLPGDSKPTLELAKERYRRRAKETHPDYGGNATEFNLVQIAWEMAQQELRA